MLCVCDGCINEAVGEVYFVLINEQGALPILRRLPDTFVCEEHSHHLMIADFVDDRGWGAICHELRDQGLPIPSLLLSKVRVRSIKESGLLE